MRFILFAAPVLSLLVLGAHFMREGGMILPAACVALILLIAWRRRWVPGLIQAALVLGTLEWIRTAYVLVQQRMAEGRPWTRMAIILGIVALITAASIAAMHALRKRYQDPR